MTPQQPALGPAPVVIMGTDGTPHVFPTGFDPVKAAGIVRASQAPKTAAQEAPAAPDLPAAGKPSPYFQKRDSVTFTPEQVKTAMTAAPYAGAGLAVALTAPVSVPGAMAAAAGGAAAGQLAKDSQFSATIGERLKNAAMVAGGAAVAEGTGALAMKGLTWITPKLLQAGRDLWLKTAKVPDAIARTSQVAKTSGVAAAKEAIADTVLSQNAGQISAKNLGGMKEVLDVLDDKLDDVIANSTGMVKRQELRDALTAKAAEFTPGSLAAKDSKKALEEAFVELNKLPPRIRVQDAQQFKRNIYKKWNYASTAADTDRAMADKTLGRAARLAIEREAPEAATINAQMSTQIPAVNAMESSLSKSQNQSTLRKLPAMVALATHSPAAAGAALLSDPTIGSWTAQQVYNLGRLVPKANRSPANILRLMKAIYQSATQKDEE